jgi:ATP/maltotriose-dependent transcriptional regulator MalT
VNRDFPLQPQGFDPERVAALADELSAEGIVERAICYYEAAGDIAVSGGSYDDAIRSYRRAIALEEQTAAARSVLFRKLAQALARAGRSDEAASVARWRLMDDAHADPAARAGDLTFLSGLHWANAQSATGLEHVMRALGDAPEGAEGFSTLVNVAALSHEIGDVERAAALLQRAQNVETDVPPPVRARFFDVLARTKMSAGFADAARADFRSALHIAREGRDADLYFGIAGNFADSMMLAGNVREALSAWKELHAQAQSLELGWHIADAALNCAACLYDLGEVREARALVDQALSTEGPTLQVRMRAATAGIPVGIALQDAPLVERVADESLIELALTSKEPARIGAVVFAFAQLYFARGRANDASTLLERAVPLLRRADHAYRLLAAAAEHAGLATARQACALLDGAVMVHRDRHSEAFNLLARSALLQRTQPGRGAAQLSSEAAGAFAELSLQHWYARALEASGRARQALMLYRTLDNAHEAARLSAIFERRKSRASAQRGLTGRQEEIASLVAQGLSNREIATRLLISEKTVENHLHVIYARLAVGSRAKLIAHWSK